MCTVSLYPMLMLSLQLYNKFPNEAMLLNLSAVKPPDLTISPTAINFTLPGQVDVFVRSANKTIQNAFTLGVVRGWHVNVECAYVCTVHVLE